MAKSKWDKYIVKRPMRYVVGEHMDLPRPWKEEVPKSVPQPKWSPADSGVQIIMTPLLVPEAYTIVEYGITSADMVMGCKGQLVQPHKHMTYEEMFLFLGTNPDNVNDLGGEVEFWMGEGDDLEKITFKEPGGVYVPKGAGHFPMIFKNVKRPIIQVIIMPRIAKRETTPINTKGRPSFD
jgi:hypothetical protein